MSAEPGVVGVPLPVLAPAPDRKTFIGGSDIAAIAGLSEFKSPFDVFLEKTGRAPAEVAPSSKGRDPLFWGKRLERIITEVYEAQEKRSLVYMFDEPIIHAERSWQGGSPDAIDMGASLVVDAKNVGLRRAHLFGEGGTDEMPDPYALQLSWYMALLGYELADLAVLIGGQDFRVYTIQRNRDLEERLLEIAYEFWTKHVQADVPPPISATETAREFLRTAFPSHILPVREAAPAEILLARQLAAVKVEKSGLEKREEEIANALKFAIGEHEGLTGKWLRVSWKAAKDSAVVDWEGLGKEALTCLQMVATVLETTPRPSRHICDLIDATKSLCDRSAIEKWTKTKPGSRRLLLSGNALKGE